jgi:hypothetical protein
VQERNEAHKVAAAGRKKKSSKKKLKDSGMTQEQLVAAQEALFARSRQVYEEQLTPRSASQTAGAAGADAGDAGQQVGKKLKVEVQETEPHSEGPTSVAPPAAVGSEPSAATPPVPPMSGLGAPTLAGMESEDDDYDDI